MPDLRELLEGPPLGTLVPARNYVGQASIQGAVPSGLLPQSNIPSQFDSSKGVLRPSPELLKTLFKPFSKDWDPEFKRGVAEELAKSISHMTSLDGFNEAAPYISATAMPVVGKIAGIGMALQGLGSMAQTARQAGVDWRAGNRYEAGKGIGGILPDVGELALGYKMGGKNLMRPDPKGRLGANLLTGGFEKEILDPKWMGMSPDTKVSKDTFIAELRKANRMPKEELQMFMELGFEKAMPKEFTPREAAAWMEKKGPKVTRRNLEVFREKKPQPESANVAASNAEIKSKLEAAGIGLTRGGSIIDARNPQRGWMDPAQFFENETDPNRRFLVQWALRQRELLTPTQTPNSWREEETKKSNPASMFIEHPEVSPVKVDQLVNPVEMLVNVGGPRLFTSKHYDKLDVDAPPVGYGQRVPKLGDNLVVHGRAHEVDLGDRRTLDLFEVQSDWAQMRKKMRDHFNIYKGTDGKWVAENSWITHNDDVGVRQDPAHDWLNDRFASKEELEKNMEGSINQLAANHPLLKQSTRLLLKAMILEAKKKGYKSISISDWETAMMIQKQEGKGFPVRRYFDSLEDAFDFRDGIASHTDVGKLKVLSGGGKYYVEATADEANRLHPEGRAGLLEGGWEFETQAGMKQHYGEGGTVRSIMEQLTGTKGTPVDMGYNQNAIEKMLPPHHLVYESDGRYVGQYNTREEAQRVVDAGKGRGISSINRPKEQFRSDLAIKKDGKLHVRNTGQEYLLDKVLDDFTTFGTDVAPTKSRGDRPSNAGISPEEIEARKAASRARKSQKNER